jgi:hypothetical protein
MKTPDQLEIESAQRLSSKAMTEAALNCKNYEDWDAAAVAILRHSIEIITKKEVQICFKK